MKKVKVTGYARRQGRLPPRDTKGRWSKKSKSSKTQGGAQLPLLGRSK